jgi:PhzF family phenazine biosynthesis protein
MEYQTAFVNAFAQGWFDGNSAAVVQVDKYPSVERMVSIARLFGFSETAFLLREAKARYRIRWFTPEVEVSLCGHATLASAGYLFSVSEQDAERIVFNSLSGELAARKVGDDIELDFPLDPPEPFQPEELVLKALGELDIVETRFATATRNLMVVLKTPDELLAVKPDFTALAELKNKPYFGIAITCAQDEGYLCRYFAPWEGINEDPVTGSAQTFLAPYWARVLGKNELKGYQASSRGGHFSVSVMEKRLLLRGKTVIYLQGMLNL